MDDETRRAAVQAFDAFGALMPDSTDFAARRANIEATVAGIRPLLDVEAAIAADANERQADREKAVSDVLELVDLLPQPDMDEHRLEGLFESSDAADVQFIQASVIWLREFDFIDSPHYLVGMRGPDAQSKKYTTLLLARVGRGDRRIPRLRAIDVPTQEATAIAAIMAKAALVDPDGEKVQAMHDPQTDTYKVNAKTPGSVHLKYEGVGLGLKRYFGGDVQDKVARRGAHVIRHVVSEATVSFFTASAANKSYVEELSNVDMHGYGVMGQLFRLARAFNKEAELRHILSPDSEVEDTNETDQPVTALDKGRDVLGRFMRLARTSLAEAIRPAELDEYTGETGHQD